jgi:hypothetical protein
MNSKTFYRLGEKCFHGEKETRSFENIVLWEEISLLGTEKNRKIS